MIPVVLAPSKRAQRKSKSRRCVHCNDVFYPRSLCKWYCLDCEDKKERAKTRALKLVAKAIKDGHMLPATSFECWDCSEPAIVFDHRNYDRALDVQPVCRACNRRRGPAAFGDN